MPTFQPISLRWLNRQSCYVCREDLTNKPSIAGRDGNRCIRCYCRNNKISEGHFQDVTAGRQCCECLAHDLTSSPAIIETQNGIFRGLICFDHRFWIDSKHDELIKKEFEAGKECYEKECFEQLKKHKEQFAKWEIRYGPQWRKRQQRAERFFFLGNILNNWLLPIPNPPEKEPLPQLYPPLGKRALCGYPELLFSIDNDPDSNPPLGQLEFEPVDSSSASSGFYYGYPLDWDERRKKCRERDEFGCCACGVKEQSKKQHHVHHIIPKAKGGNHSLQNLVTLCDDCHALQEYYDHKDLLKKARSPK